MKATGIVRRIDDLGRVVIPKEIRRGLHIIENDPLEIFVDNDSVIFKKYMSDAVRRQTLAAVIGNTKEFLIRQNFDLAFITPASTISYSTLPKNNKIEELQLDEEIFKELKQRGQDYKYSTKVFISLNENDFQLLGTNPPLFNWKIIGSVKVSDDEANDVGYLIAFVRQEDEINLNENLSLKEEVSTVLSCLQKTISGLTQ